MNTDPKAYIFKLSLSTEWRSQWRLSGARGNLVNALRDRKIRWRLPSADEMTKLAGDGYFKRRPTRVNGGALME